MKFAALRKKFFSARKLAAGTLPMVLAFSAQSADAVAVEGEVDITAAVRTAGKGTTTLVDGHIVANTIDNAFGAGMSTGDRVLLRDPYNIISYSIEADFEAEQPILVTRYAIRRSVALNGVEDVPRKRAPTAFRLEGSADGTYWVTLDARSGVDWVGTGDDLKSFEIDALNVGSYRHYRFVPVTSAADPGDGARCSFQFVNLFGTIGSQKPLLRTSAFADHLVTHAAAATTLSDYKPTLGSSLELDVSFSKLEGMVALFAANKYDEAPHFRLFYDNDNGGRWIYYYGDKSYESTVKAYPGARYKVVVDGPVVSVNGVKIIDAGDRLSASTSRPLSLFASLDGSGNLVRMPSLSVWSVKATDANGVVVRDLRPILAGDGSGCLYDTVNDKLYESARTENRLVADYRLSDNEVEVTKEVRAAGSPTVTLVEGTVYSSDYPITNLFTAGNTVADRVLLKTKRNVVQYDIPASFRPNQPVVVTRYAIMPAVGDASSSKESENRAPTVVELQASEDGETWVTLHRRDSGLGAGSYHCGDYVANGYGYNGVCMNIPEDKRGDYRHYRFITENSSATEGDSVKIALQELRFFGYIGGLDANYEPIEYVQNANENAYQGNTYFRTGVVPRMADLTVELTGEFTRTDATMGLFCCRGTSADPRSWTLFHVGGKLRLDCGSTGSESTFSPVANTPYVIKVVGNRLFVGKQEIYTSGTTGFTPGSELVLMASHNATQNINNQARFKIRACKVIDPLRGVIRDYIPVRRTADGVAGLFDRVNATFLPASGESPKRGEAVDIDFRQRGRDVRVTSALDNGKLPKDVELAFGDNQFLSATLYAAFDNENKGESLEAWAEVKELVTVRTGTDSVSVRLACPKEYRKARFFVRDAFGCVSHTQTYGVARKGLSILVR